MIVGSFTRVVVAIRGTCALFHSTATLATRAQLLWCLVMWQVMLEASPLARPKSHAITVGKLDTISEIVGS